MSDEEFEQQQKDIKHDGDIKQEDEELIFNPYNSKNVEITHDEICEILKKYGVPDKLHNIKLYKRAFIHKSYCKRPHLENLENEVILAPRPNDCMPLKTKSNERLEFLGDGVLECITKYYLYRRFPKANEGFMTEKKIALVKNESIGKMVYEMGLNKWYIISGNAEEKKTRTNLKKLGCLFEAFLGALFLDFNKIQIHDEDKWFDQVFVTGPGFQIAQTFVENIFETHVNWTNLIISNENYKNILQMKLQKHYKVTPYYIEMSEYDEEEGYHMGVYLYVGYEIHEKTNDNVVKISDIYKNNNFIESINNYLENNEEKIILFLSESKHKIKKKAEQEACRIVINKYVV